MKLNPLASSVGKAKPRYRYKLYIVIDGKVQLAGEFVDYESAYKELMYIHGS